MFPMMLTVSFTKYRLHQDAQHHSIKQKVCSRSYFVYTFISKIDAHFYSNKKFTFASNSGSLVLPHSMFTDEAQFAHQPFILNITCKPMSFVMCSGCMSCITFLLINVVTTSQYECFTHIYFNMNEFVVFPTSVLLKSLSCASYSWSHRCNTGRNAVRCLRTHLNGTAAGMWKTRNLYGISIP